MAPPENDDPCLVLIYQAFEKNLHKKCNLLLMPNYMRKFLMPSRQERENDGAVFLARILESSDGRQQKGKVFLREFVCLFDSLFFSLSAQEDPNSESHVLSTSIMAGLR